MWTSPNFSPGIMLFKFFAVLWLVFNDTLNISLVSPFTLYLLLTDALCFDVMRALGWLLYLICEVSLHKFLHVAFTAPLFKFIEAALEYLQGVCFVVYVFVTVSLTCILTCRDCLTRAETVHVYLARYDYLDHVHTKQRKLSITFT